MIYQSGRAFRRALEDRLLAQSTQGDVSLVRLRKLVAFDRFLARLLQAQPDAWLLKGGLALQLRLGARARATKDVDMLLTLPPEEIQQALTTAAQLDLRDWFRFSVQQDASSLPGPREGGQRFNVTALLDDRTFESFHVDVGSGDPVLEPAESLTTPPLLAFAGIPPLTVPCYPITQHLAEKIHAYMKPRAGGESTRVKDLVDIVLIAGNVSVDASGLGRAIAATFAAQGSGAPPVSLPVPPATWATNYRKLAREVGISCDSLPEAFEQARRFMDPALAGHATGVWSPTAQAWL